MDHIGTLVVWARSGAVASRARAATLKGGGGIVGTVELGVDARVGARSMPIRTVQSL